MPSIAEPLVHNKETTAQFDPIPSYGQSLRHSCYPAYLAAERMYSRLDDRKDRTRADRLRSCRSDAWFCRHVETGEIRIASNACHLRWCPVCSQSRRNYISHSVAEWCGSADHPKFLTLTLRHSDAPLDFQIKNLYGFFRELRRRREVKKRVKGGIWFFQIKRSKTDGLWHPHLHCLIEGMYLYQRKLSRMWSQITYGSHVVDIRSVHDPQAAANDAAKYAASPGSLVDLSNSDACELVTALHGRRICGTWGTGRAVSLCPPKQSDKDNWKCVGDWMIVMNSRESNANARAIINAWKDKQPLEPGIDCNPVEDFIVKHERSLWESCDLDEVHQTERSPP